MLPITIVLTDGYSDWEIAVLSGLGSAFYGADITFASPAGGPLASVAGLKVANTERFQSPARGVVVICGGPIFESDAIPDTSDRLRSARENGCVIAGICGGTVALARAGLLDDVRHTSNGPKYLDSYAPGYNGAGRYVDQPFALLDNRIITAPAPAPASFAVEVLTAAGLDSEVAKDVKRLLAKEHRL